MKKISLFIIPILFFLSCEKKQCRDINNYTFEIPFTLTPALDTFKVGDTITFHSRFEKNLTEYYTDEIYTLENFKFFPGTELNQIDVSPAIDATSSFNLITENPTDYVIESRATRQYLGGEYNFDGQFYNLTFKLIPTKNGLFHLEQTPRLRFGNNQTFAGKCSNKDFESISNINDGADNNIDLLLDSPDSHFNTWILEKPFKRFTRAGGYCFYVVE